MMKNEKHVSHILLLVGKVNKKFTDLSTELFIYVKRLYMHALRKGDIQFEIIAASICVKNRQPVHLCFRDVEAST